MRILLIKDDGNEQNAIVDVNFRAMLDIDFNRVIEGKQST